MTVTWEETNPGSGSKTHATNLKICQFCKFVHPFYIQCKGRNKTDDTNQSRHVPKTLVPESVHVPDRVQVPESVPVNQSIQIANTQQSNWDMFNYLIIYNFQPCKIIVMYSIMIISLAFLGFITFVLYGASNTYSMMEMVIFFMIYLK